MARLGTGAPLHGPPCAPAPPYPFFPLRHPSLDEPNHGTLGHGGSFAWPSTRASDECTGSLYLPLRNSIIKITSLSPTVVSTCVSMPPDYLFPPLFFLFSTHPSTSQTMARLGMGAPLHGPHSLTFMDAPFTYDSLSNLEPYLQYPQSPYGISTIVRKSISYLISFYGSPLFKCLVPRLHLPASTLTPLT